MKIFAVSTITYNGQDFTAGQIYDVSEDEARELVGRGYAHPFGLEDPATYSLAYQQQNQEPPPVEELPPGPATVTILPTSANVAVGGDSGTIVVTITSTGPGTWIVDSASAPDWVIYAPTSEQTADGDVDYSVEPNATGEVRVGTLTINGQTFTINQEVGEPAQQPNQ